MNDVKIREDEELATDIEALCHHQGYKTCRSCHTPVTIGMMSWNCGIGQTEAGTEYSVINCICDRCESDIFQFCSWRSEIVTLEDLLYVLEADLPHAREDE